MLDRANMRGLRFQTATAIDQLQPLTAQRRTCVAARRNATSELVAQI